MLPGRMLDLVGISEMLLKASVLASRCTGMVLVPGSLVAQWIVSLFFVWLFPGLCCLVVGVEPSCSECASY